jgi:hypothetical protein
MTASNLSASRIARTAARSPMSPTTRRGRFPQIRSMRFSDSGELFDRLSRIVIAWPAA